VYRYSRYFVALCIRHSNPSPVNIHALSSWKNITSRCHHSLQPLGNFPDPIDIEKLKGAVAAEGALQVRFSVILLYNTNHTDNDLEGEMDTARKPTGKRLLLVLGAGISMAAVSENALPADFDQQLIAEVGQEMQQYRQDALHEMQTDLRHQVSQILVLNRDLIESQLAEAEKAFYPEKQAFNLAECDQKLVAE
jgi:hypothetical protein